MHLVPRKEIEEVDASLTMEEVDQKFVGPGCEQTGSMRQNLDHVTGYVHQLDLFKNPHSSKRSSSIPIPAVAGERMSATDPDQQVHPGKKEHRLGGG